MIVRKFLRWGLLPLIVVGITACGGGSGGGEAEEEVVVLPTSCDSDPASIECQAGGSNEGGQTTDVVNLETIAIGATASGALAGGEAIIYRVPAGTEVILSALTGNPNLFLYSSEAVIEENLLCSANRPFAEDSCAAPDDVGDVYAHVFSREPSTYTIGVSADCSVGAVNQWVYRNMKDYYIYADRVPDVDPASYASPSELVRDLRFFELDPYTGVSDDAAGQQAFLEEGMTFGLGFTTRRDANNNPRVIFSYDDSPAGRAGIKRGDILVGLNNELWGEISNERFFQMLGTEDNPLPNSWQFIDGETGDPISVTLTQAQFRVNTVLHTGTYTNPSFDGRTGYIVFNEFLRISEAELDASINQILAAGATELILDLRYNPGGFTSIARKLASQIGGADLADNLLVRYEYNSKYTSQNFERNFVAESPVLNFDRVVVLTTGRTASSSELLINALSPYIDVVVMGQRTEGKAFISVANQYCGRSLSAMEAQGVNADGISVAGGIPPNCFAADDITRDFGGTADGIEGMLESALDYVVFGVCDAPVLTKQPTVFSSRLDVRPFTGAVEDFSPN